MRLISVLFAGCFSERKQSSDDQVVDDVEMIELDVAVKLKKSIEDVMRGVVVYVEVRAENEDRSDGIKTIVGEMGAQVNDRLYKYCFWTQFNCSTLNVFVKF